MTDPALDNIEALTISDFAYIIAQDWDKPYFGAVPYLDAMKSIDTLDEMYGYDTADSVVRYFLSNANTWKGETARLVKTELKRRLK